MHGIRGNNRTNRIVTMSGPYNGNEKPSGVISFANTNNNSNFKLYVGNLAWDVTWQNLKDYMRTAGRVVTADVMIDSEGKSKGYGLVSFMTAEDAQQAINKLNNTELNGRKISIREDRNTQAESGRPNNSTGHQEEIFNSNKVYVGNLSFNVTWQDLKDHMRTAGDRVVTADVVTTPDGRSRGYGLVTFVTAREAAHAASSLSESELQGRKIFVREDRDAVRSGDQNKFQQSDNSAVNSDRNTKVYVGNLAWDVSWQDLKDYMRTAGGRVVTADVAMEGTDSHRSKGFGLVTFASAQEAEDAIVRLNDTELKGRKIFVREDREAGSHQDGQSNRHNDIDYRARGLPHSSSPSPQQQEVVVVVVASPVVYVGNLSWDVTVQDLEEHMQRGGGQVLRAEVLREDSGRSKGCGLVEFDSVEDASHAVSVLNESELNGRKMFVRFDRELYGNRGEGSLSKQHAPEFKLFVGNIAWAVRWQDLKDHFKQAGLAVTHADVQMRGDDNSRSKGYGFVSFETREEADRAVSALNGSTLLDRQIIVRQDFAQ